MTNFDHIKAMTVEEMAEFLTLKVFERTVEIANADCFLCDETHCTKCLKQWLESKVTE